LIQKFKVTGITCGSCERKIENALKETDGVASASWSGELLQVDFNLETVTAERIMEILRKLGYSIQTEDAAQPEFSRWGKFVAAIAIAIAAYIILDMTAGFALPKVDSSLSLGMLFVIGLLTSVHCIAMCGGINLSQTLNTNSTAGDLPGQKLRPALLYNLGRVLSYTAIGAIAGGVGAVLSFSEAVKAAIMIAAGIFMILLALRMLGLLPHFRWRFWERAGANLTAKSSGKGPLMVGILNGLMPCGPLQAMQLYAMGTGSPWKGALAMMLFSLGTVPLMVGLGTVGSYLKSGTAKKVVWVGAILVMVFGLLMVQRGIGLSGTPVTALNNGNVATAKISDNIQLVTTTISARSYPPIIVQQGVPVRWIIKASAANLNGCNNRIIIPKYGIEKPLVPGDNIVEFTPRDSGTIGYSCWMGMITSYIKVVPDLAKANSSVSAPVNNTGYGNRSGCCAVPGQK
jgi:sulfite exporter TauE/SafE/copper chaperone CopZ